MELKKTETNPVVVIGGGIAGLSTAFWLDRGQIPVILLESSERTGGVIKTRVEDGYLVEHGPSTLQGRTAELLETVEAAGLTERVVYANDYQNNRYILKRGVPVRLPLGPMSFIGTKLFSFRAKARLMAEPFIKPSGMEDESVSSFVSRRLGKEFLDFAVAPFVCGIYAGDPDRISFRNSFPRLYALEEEYGSLVGGMVKRMLGGSMKKKNRKPKPRLFSFIDGLEELPKALSNRLGDKVKIGYSVEKIEYEAYSDADGSFRVICANGNRDVTVKASAVVMAVTSSVTERLTGYLSGDGNGSLADVPYAPMAVVSLAYDKERISHPLNGFGMLSPPSEPHKLLGSLWTSQFFKGRAPEGKVLLTNFLGGMCNPDLVELGENALVELVHDELTPVLGITGKPEYTKVIKWRKAIPQYNLGHHNIVKDIEEIEARYPGLYISGAFRGGVAVEDAVAKAMKTALEVGDHLKKTLEKKGAGINV